MSRPQLLLCYHKVGPVGEEGRWMNVEPERLRAQVRYFVRRGWGFRTASQAPDGELGTVGFQFDDAYASALRHALPIFADFGVRATFWAVPSLVGATSIWDADRAAPLADWLDLAAAQKAGHEIGNHTFSHPRLSTLDLHAQCVEITRACTALADRGCLSNVLCYPYGDHDETTLKAVRRLHLAAAFSLAKRPVQPTDDVHALPRIAVAYSDTVAGLLYKIYIRPLLP